MRVLILHNEKSGQGEAGFKTFLAALERGGVEYQVRSLEEGVKLEDLLADAPEFGAVVAAGGDGTVSGTAHALRDSDVPILAYPKGTANLIALNLKLPSEPAELAEVLLAGRSRAVDLAVLRYCDPSGQPRESGFTIAAGTGFDAKLIADSENLKSRFGVGGYVLSALSNAKAQVARFRLELDGETLEREGIGVMVVNLGQMQLGLEMAPGADAADGRLEVVILKARTAAGLVPELLRQLAEKVGLGSPEVGERLEVCSARHVRIESEPALAVQYDGESLEARPPLEAQILPGAARFIVPTE